MALDVGRCTLRQARAGRRLLPRHARGAAPPARPRSPTTAASICATSRCRAGSPGASGRWCRRTAARPPTSPAFHAMLERYGGMRAQVVTGIHDDAGALVGDPLGARAASPAALEPRTSSRASTRPPTARGGRSRDRPRAAAADPAAARRAPDRGHNRWHPELPPAVEVEPGDEVVVDCRDGLDGLVTPTTRDEDLHSLELARAHPMSGPIAVRGARPGDVLRVEILEIAADDFGSTAVIPGFGLLAAEFPEPYLVTWGCATASPRGPHARHPGAGRPVPRGASAWPRRPSAWPPSRPARPRSPRTAASRCRRSPSAPCRPPSPTPPGPAHHPAARDGRQPRRARRARRLRDVLSRRRRGRAALARRRALRAGRRRGLRHGDRDARAGAPALDVVPRDRARWLPSTPAFESTEPAAPATAATSSPPACPSTPTARTATWTCCWRPATRCAR